MFVSAGGGRIPACRVSVPVVRNRMTPRSSAGYIGFMAPFHIALVHLLVSPILLFAQPDRPDRGVVGSLLIRDSLEQEAVRRDLDIISFGLEIVPSPGGGSFFDEYKNLFGMTTGLNPAVSPTIVGRIRMLENLRLVFAASYIGSGFSEVYDAYGFPAGMPEADTLVPAAQVVDEMSVTAFSFLLGIQFTPIRSQFTSYVGAAAGGAFVTASWQTNTRRFESSNYFRPETNVDGPAFAPALRLFTGVDLRFDGSYMNKNVFRGVYIEAAYFYLPVTLDYFREIRTIGRGIPVLPADDNATLNIGGLTVTFGINMQLLRL